MRSTLNQKPADDPHDFVVVPSDHVQVAPSDDEISDLLRAAARQRAESQGSQADAPELSAAPSVDATFRPSDVNHDLLGRRRAFGRRMMRAFAAVLLAFCVGAAAVAWQASGYAFKKVALKWLPKAAVTALPLEKLGVTSSSTTTDEDAARAEAEPQQTVPATPAPAEAPETKAAAEAAQPLDAAASMQSMARDLANVSQEVETLKATIAELKESQQQMARELAKANDKANELNTRAKLSSVQPHPPAAPPARKPVPAYSPSPPVSAAPAYRQPPPYPPTQAAAQPAPVPQSVQPYPQAYPQTLPPPPADTGLVTAPRPPLPVQ